VRPWIAGRYGLETVFSPPAMTTETARQGELPPVLRNGKMSNAISFVAPWQVTRVPSPGISSLESRDVLVEVKASGICGTDLGIIAGDYWAKPGVVLGHEAAGIVADVGADVCEFAIGDRASIDPTFACGCCRFCRSNRANHCERKNGAEAGVSADGTFRNYYKTTPRFLYKIADHVSFEAATLAEPLSCALTGTAQLRIHRTFRVVVIGSGPIGVLYTWALSLRGLVGVITDSDAGRLRVGGSVLPIGWHTVQSLEAAASCYAGDAQPFDVVVDTTSQILGPSLQRLARGGQFVAVGLKPGNVPIDIGAVADRSLAIIGSIDSMFNSFSEAVALISREAVPAERIVTHNLPISAFEEALSLLGLDLLHHNRGPTRDALKVVVHPDGC
jgi:threonine dehydrogenase-like Zn-dependent dehydrogenase